MEAIDDIVFMKPRPRYLGMVLKGALSRRAKDFEPALRPVDQDEYDETSGEDDVGKSAQAHHKTKALGRPITPPADPWPTVRVVRASGTCRWHCAAEVRS